MFAPCPCARLIPQSTRLSFGMDRTISAKLLDRFAFVLRGSVVALVAVGAYTVSKWRDAIDDDTNTASELLTNFREMHSRGDLTDEEFRTIKARLSYEIQEEIKNSDNED